MLNELSDDQCSEVLAQLDRLDKRVGLGPTLLNFLDLKARWPERRVLEFARRSDGL